MGILYIHGRGFTRCRLSKSKDLQVIFMFLKKIPVRKNIDAGIVTPAGSAVIKGVSSA